MAHKQERISDVVERINAAAEDDPELAEIAKIPQKEYSQNSREKTLKLKESVFFNGKFYKAGTDISQFDDETKAAFAPHCESA
ncbi:MAG: hypothetical protein FWF51_06545 [Chitinivibrionia bacterium]|nr:hypothetical protein [Chitinivibrionia bacterium]